MKPECRVVSAYVLIGGGFAALLGAESIAKHLIPLEAGASFDIGELETTTLNLRIVAASAFVFGLFERLFIQILFALGQLKWD